MRKTIRVIYKPVGHQCEVRTIPNTLEACQDLVGGYIEIVPLDEKTLIVCNEEGRIRGLAPNRFLGIDLVGDVFVCGRRGEDLANAPRSLIRRLQNADA